jgi:elongation factor G
MTYQVVPIPADMMEEATEWREKLLKQYAEYDDNLMEKFFDDPESITEREILTSPAWHVRNEDCSDGLRFIFQEQRCTNHARPGDGTYAFPLDKENVTKGTNPDTDEEIVRKPDVQ